MKYIAANLLREEINRRIKIHNELSEKPEMSDLRLELQMVNNNLQGIISFIDSIQQEMWKPSYEQMKALEVAGKTFASFKELNMNTQRAWKIFHEPLESLGNDLVKLMKL